MPDFLDLGYKPKLAPTNAPAQIQPIPRANFQMTTQWSLASDTSAVGLRASPEYLPLIVTSPVSLDPTQALFQQPRPPVDPAASEDPDPE